MQLQTILSQPFPHGFPDFVQARFAVVQHRQIVHITQISGETQNLLEVMIQIIRV